MVGSLKERVGDIITRYANTEDFTVDSTLAEIGIGLENYDEIAVEIEGEFDVDTSDFEGQLSESEFEDATVQDVIDAVKRCL